MKMLKLWQKPKTPSGIYGNLIESTVIKRISFVYQGHENWEKMVGFGNFVILANLYASFHLGTLLHGYSFTKTLGQT